MVLGWRFLGNKFLSRFQGFWKTSKKPLVSEVLTSYLIQTNEPPWTSYFVKYSDIVNDQRGMSHFNWPVGRSNYHVLRTGCFPYIKYHCTKRPKQDLSMDDKLFKAIKIVNLDPSCIKSHKTYQHIIPASTVHHVNMKKGIPTLTYGLAATQLIRHQEIVKTPRGDVTIYFLLPEDKGARY